MNAINNTVRSLVLLLVSILIISCASTEEKMTGVIFTTPSGRISMEGGDIYNVTSQQEESGTYLVTLWLGDPGIQKLSIALAKSDNKQVSLHIADKKILSNKLIENVSTLYRIQMRAADAKVANELVAGINNARQLIVK